MQLPYPAVIQPDRILSMVHLYKSLRGIVIGGQAKFEEVEEVLLFLLHRPSSIVYMYCVRLVRVTIVQGSVLWGD